MEAPEISNPVKRYCTYHWLGFYNFITFFALFPIAFLPPMKQNTVIFVWIVMLLWYTVDIFPPGITSFLPILVFPPMGVMSSDITCMNFSQNAALVLGVSTFVAITFEISKTAERLAFIWVKIFSHRPRVLLLSLMITTWLMSALVPNAAVCALMMPLTKNVIQVLETISVGKLLDENKEVASGEPPHPTHLTIGFALGVAFAATIGGMTTLSGSDTGLTIYKEYTNTAPNAKGQITYLNYLIVTAPLSLLLLIFTIFYLEILFLGLLRKNSPDNLIFDNQASRDALNTAMTELPPPTIYNYLLILLYIILIVLCIFLQPVFMDGLADILNEKSVKHSAVIMMVCFAIFILPSTYDFLKYFICKEPKEYKTAPSMLNWPAVHKNMIWNYYLTFGGSLTLAESIRKGHWPIYISSHTGNGSMVDRLYYLSISAVLTIMGADHIVARSLYNGAARKYLILGSHPGNAVHAILFGAQLSFFLPMSSVANCFACGWFNIRARHVMLAGIGPLIMGLLLSAAVLLTLVPVILPELTSAPY